MRTFPSLFLDQTSFNPTMRRTVLTHDLLLGYQLAIKSYTSGDDSMTLSSQQAEDVIVGQALEAYDGASNGNKTRGGVKKANDM